MMMTATTANNAAAMYSTSKYPTHSCETLRTVVANTIKLIIVM